MSTRYWIGVVSASHVARGVTGGFAQMCHGKAAPLKRMRAGDWLIYYSPKTEMNNGTPLQQFTAIGQVKDEHTYQVDMFPGFQPFRRDIRFVPCQPAAIAPLVAHLSFIPDKQHWGYRFRFGHLEIPAADFWQIAQAMQADLSSVSAINPPTQGLLSLHP